MGQYTDRAKELRPIIVEASKSLPDDEASKAPELFLAWSGDGVAYAVDDRVRYEDGLYRVLQNHTSQDDWTPTNAPALFAEILPGQEPYPVMVRNHLSRRNRRQ